MAKHLSIVAKKDGFRRAGRSFSDTEATLIPLSALSADETAALKGERMLVVQETEIADTAPAAPATTREETLKDEPSKEESPSEVKKGRNSPHITIIGAKGSPTPPHEWAAVLGAQCAFHGKQDPARPFQTLELPGVLAPQIVDRFTFSERNILLRGGISTFTVDSGGMVRIERVITTYQENAYGVADPSYLDLNTLKTLAYLRYDLRAFIAITYPRHKLADDGTAFSRGQAVVTPRVLRASIIARFRLWEEKGLAENIDQFKEDLIVERDATDVNRVNALVPPDIVNQLRVFAGLVQFRL